jgi:hypothetical protein
VRQKNINLQNQGSFDKKFDIFFPDPKSHTQVGSLSAKNAKEKFSRLGTIPEFICWWRHAFLVRFIFSLDFRYE